MATSSKKLSQQELRQLMREKVQSKKDIRIDSPLARYDDRGQLWCRICNQIINNEFLWSTHLIGKSHKKVFDFNSFFLSFFGLTNFFLNRKLKN